MAKLIYSAIQSLDGYLADDDGNFEWVEPDEDVHTFINDLERPAKTYLYGRRMYDHPVVLGVADASSLMTAPSDPCG
jgi:dihydrofolate reductase